MAFKGMPAYSGTSPTYDAVRPNGTPGSTSSAGTRHLGSRHPPVRSLWPRTAGTFTGSGIPSGTLWNLLQSSPRPFSGQLWPR